MPYNRGTVVEVNWPHSDGLTVSRRPALVVQCERVTHMPPDQYVCALITSKSTHVGGPCVHVKLGSPEGTAAGLTKDCFIVLDALATVKASIIYSTRGIFSRMDLVDAKLRLSLRLP